MNAKPRHVERALHERVEIVPYDPAWPGLFAEEVARLRAALPADLIGRIEHYRRNQDERWELQDIAPEQALVLESLEVSIPWQKVFRNAD